MRNEEQGTRNKGGRSPRPLNTPAPVRVRADPEGRPAAVGVRVGERRAVPLRAVSAIADTWRIDDEWWRERPVSRLYYRLALEDGTALTVYQDLLTGAWWRQEVDNGSATL